MIQNPSKQCTIIYWCCRFFYVYRYHIWRNIKVVEKSLFSNYLTVLFRTSYFPRSLLVDTSYPCICSRPTYTLRLGDGRRCSLHYQSSFGERRERVSTFSIEVLVKGLFVKRCICMYVFGLWNERFRWVSKKGVGVRISSLKCSWGLHVLSNIYDDHKVTSWTNERNEDRRENYSGEG